jgi:hypothetical protein
MLQAGVGAYNTGMPTPRAKDSSKQIDLEVRSFDNFDGRNIIEDPTSTVVLITVSERELSGRVSGGEIRPCRSLTTAQDIISCNPNLRVFLIHVSSLTSMTGIDVLAGLLGGASGVIDERGLIMQEVLAKIAEHKAVSRRYKSMLLIGQITNQIEAIKAMVDEWDMDVESDPSLDLASWRAAMALAQLEKLEPIIGSGHATSFSTLAETLNLAQFITSFRLNPDDLRRVLATLARRWLGENHEPLERLKMPDYARSHGFTRCPPVINSLDHVQTPRALYHALQKIEIARQDDTAGMTRCLVKLR